MTRIGLLSDTHSWIYPGIFDFLNECDQIWHAGDIGNLDTYEQLREFKPLRAVFGNIDGESIRRHCQEVELFHCEQLKVLMKHIGGYPGRYNKSVKPLLDKEQPSLFVCGHSHILKVMYDDKRNLMHMNPGAAGRYGLHTMITCLRFSIDGRNIRDLEILEKEKNNV